MDYDKLLDEIEDLQIAAYSNNIGTNEEQLEVRTEIIKLLKEKTTVEEEQCKCIRCGDNHPVCLKDKMCYTCDVVTEGKF